MWNWEETVWSLCYSGMTRWGRLRGPTVALLVQFSPPSSHSFSWNRISPQVFLSEEPDVLPRSAHSCFSWIQMLSPAAEGQPWLPGASPACSSELLFPQQPGIGISLLSESFPFRLEQIENVTLEAQGSIFLCPRCPTRAWPCVV